MCDVTFLFGAKLYGVCSDWSGHFCYCHVSYTILKCAVSWPHWLKNKTDMENTFQGSSHCVHDGTSRDSQLCRSTFTVCVMSHFYYMEFALTVHALVIFVTTIY